MKKIKIGTKSRGFLIELFNTKFNFWIFNFEKDNLYEINSRKKMILSKLAKNPLLDYLGIIESPTVITDEHDLVFSYNRFLKTNQSYIIYLENPLALVHYSTRRPKTNLGKRKIRKFLTDPNLKAIVCLSKACESTLRNFYDIPNKIIVDQIYPLVSENPYITESLIQEKCTSQVINCLYISSNFELKGGEDILEVFARFKRNGNNNIRLSIITTVINLSDEIKDKIALNRNIALYDFSFNRKELYKIYSESVIYLNPTRQDSFSLVTLEALKAANVVISSDLYALPEMIEEENNGYLIQPLYRFFNYDNMPNQEVWNNRKRTIYSNYRDEAVIDKMEEKITYLYENRIELIRMAENSFHKANSEEFSVEYIKSKWELIFNSIDVTKG